MDVLLQTFAQWGSRWSKPDLAKLRLVWGTEPVPFGSKDSRERVFRRLLWCLSEEVPKKDIPRHIRKLDRKLGGRHRASDGKYLAGCELPGGLRGHAPEIKKLLSALPPLEAAIVDLYFFGRKTQMEIARAFKISQPTVCYRIYRAITRLEFLLGHPQPMSSKGVARVLTPLQVDPRDVDVLASLWDTSCQIETARRLGTSQGYVRYRAVMTLERLKKNHQAPTITAWFDAMPQNIFRDVGQKGCLGEPPSE